MNRLLTITIGLLLLVTCYGTVTWGETPWSLVWENARLRLMGQSSEWNPLLDERLPRLLVILCSGASWAVSGIVMQALFHNPLASPMSLGLTAGSSLLVVMLFVLGWHLHYPVTIPIAAFTGSLITLLVVYAVSRHRDHVQMNRLILTGIAFSTVLMAIQGAVIYAFRDQWTLMQTLAEWEAGSTTDRSWQHVHLQLPLTLIGLTGCWIYRQEMNLLALGAEEATNLGVDVRQVRWRLFLCVSLLIGGSVAAIGVIAFFGLVLPHMLRKLIGPDHRVLVPLCITAGSATLGTLDLLLRAFAVHSFSIGSVSSVIGGLFFLVLLCESRTQDA